MAVALDGSGGDERERWEAVAVRVKERGMQSGFGLLL